MVEDFIILFIKTILYKSYAKVSLLLVLMGFLKMEDNVSRIKEVAEGKMSRVARA
jgi:hypothetical protein